MSLSEQEQGYNQGLAWLDDVISYCRNVINIINDSLKW